MRQILCNQGGVLVARQPRPAVRAGCVLVRVRYSLVSVGTELAGLRKESNPDETHIERAAAITSRAWYYLGKAVQDPRKAAGRVREIALRKAAELRPRPRQIPAPHFALEGLQWTTCAAREFTASEGRVELLTDESPAAYQAMSQPIAIEDGRVPLLVLEGQVHEGGISIGLLNEDRSTWLGTHQYSAGCIQDRISFDPQGSRSVTVVLANDGQQAPSRVTLDSIQMQFVPADENGLPHNELADQGWNLGYSAAGEVVAVGEGVSDFAMGDLVACAGAGYANHADYVCVPKNLVCRVPRDCDASIAATTTVGAIALQGVRRAAPQLGETVCVLGLGLIGQITAQLLSANGCRVLGFDLSADRVERAKKLGIDAGACDAEQFARLVRDLTAGRGVDRTLITAATKSDAVINQAMQLTRAKGTVVIVGDIGLKIDRAQFYRKEIDLLMSTSYGPGRYDASYEEDGHDYPFAYVRWTLHRNMQAYLDLCASGRLRIAELIDRTLPVDQAPQAYRELAQTSASAPLGVLIQYPDDPRRMVEPANATAIHIRGARPVRNEPLKYALVGCGGFGTGMLVPQMQKRPDRFFLKAIVSRNAAQAGNYARTQRVDVLASELAPVLADPEIDLVVIATRHHEHAQQVCQCLAAGKHVFVEKPLALSWEQLDQVVAAHQQAAGHASLMVGFNRRFAPAVQAVQAELLGRRSPLVIQYRLHGGYIALDHWVQTAQGGGRNLGEACHMYDLFRALAGARVKSIQAASIDPGELPYRRNDNFCATVQYDDGSLANLTYTALGPKQGLGKERIEIFCDGECWLIDDFKRVVRSSDQAVLWSSSEPDKGHFEELSQWGDAIARGAAPPIPFDQLVETTAVSLQVEDLLFGRNLC